MKTIIKSLLLLAVMAFVLAVPAIAQDSTAVTPVTGYEGKTNWELISIILYVVYEALVRWVPTSRNWSIVGLLIKLIQKIFPNANSTGSNHA